MTLGSCVSLVGNYWWFELVNLRIKPHFMQKNCSLQHPQVMGSGWNYLSSRNILSFDQFDIALRKKRSVTVTSSKPMYFIKFGWSRQKKNWAEAAISICSFQHWNWSARPCEGNSDPWRTPCSAQTLVQVHDRSRAGGPDSWFVNCTNVLIPIKGVKIS